MLAEASRTAAAAALETSLAEFKAQLDSEGRLELAPLLAEELANISKDQFQANAIVWQDRIVETLAQTRNFGLIAMASAFGLLALAYWGRPRQIARWFYVLLIMCGGSSLAFLTLAYFALPRVVDRVVSSAWMGGQVEVEGLVVLILDIVISVISSRLVALMWLAGSVLAVGVLVWAAFLTWDITRGKRQGGEQAQSEPAPSNEVVA